MTSNAVEVGPTRLADDDRGSNSGQNRSNFKPQGSWFRDWGVDRLSFSFPIIGHDHFRDIWHRGKKRSPGDSQWKLVDWIQIPFDCSSVDENIPHLYVEVYKLPGSLLYSARIEFNPSRVVDPYGISLCPVADLLYAVGIAWDIAGTVVEPDCQLDEGRIRRVDVARDFAGIRALGPYLTAWSKIASPYAAFSRIEYDPTTGVAETQYKGSQTGGRTTVYDKYSQLPTKATPGAVRFEVQAYRRWCKTIADIECVADISHSSLLVLITNRWEWSGCATPICGLSAFTQRVELLTEKNGEVWSEIKKDAFRGQQLRAYEGVAEPLPKGRQAMYNKALLKTGVPSLAELAGTGHEQEIAFLDFETGREVIHAA